MTKYELAQHIDAAHPEHIWPKLKDGLGKWRKDELEHTHADLHRSPFTPSHPGP